MLNRNIFSKQLSEHQKEHKRLKIMPKAELYFYLLTESASGTKKKVCIYESEDSLFWYKYSLCEKANKKNEYMPTLKPVVFKRLVIDMPISSAWVENLPNQSAFAPSGTIVRRISKKTNWVQVHDGACKAAKFELLIPVKLSKKLHDSDLIMFDGADGIITKPKHK